MSLQTIRIEGNIFSPEVLEKPDKKIYEGKRSKILVLPKGIIDDNLQYQKVR
jgi:hypothetical protein